MSGVARLRLKAAVARYGPSFVVAFALCGILLLGMAGWTYANPPTTEVTERTHEQTVRSELHTNATATGNTSLYEPGTRLEDQPVYLLAEAPSVTLTQRTSLPETRGVHVEQDVQIRYRVAHDGSVFWRESHLVADGETTTSDGAFVTRAVLDVRGVRTRLSEIRSEVGRAGTVRVRLRLTVSYATGEYEGKLTRTVPIQFADSWYGIDAKPLERTHSTPETRRVPLPNRNPLEYVLPGGIGVGLLVAAGAVAVRYRRGFDRRRLEHRLQQRRYAEWISTGSTPDSFAGPTVSVDSLEGLVDVAIDTDSRVIHDERNGSYVVLDGSVVYRYSPGGAPQTRSE